MRNAMEAAGLLEPAFDMEGFFIVTLLRGSAINVGKDVALSEIQKGILYILSDNPKLTAVTLAER